MRKILAFFTITCLIALGACGSKESSNGGLAKQIQGEVSLEHGGKTEPMKTGDRFESGDTIRTGANGIAVVVIKGSLAQAEIQPNSQFRLDSKDLSNKIQLDKGNLWLSVTKASSKEEFTVQTPTSIAGVRGTKFYTAQLGDAQIVCICEGDVDYEAGSTKKDTHTDTLIYTKGGKTVTIVPKDVPGFIYAHNHSELEDSPLGRQNKMSPEMREKLLKFAEEKLKEVK